VNEMRAFLLLVITLAVLNPAGPQTPTHTEMPVVTQASPLPNYKPKDGYVPNEITAVRIAEAVLLPIYTDKVIKAEMPLSATLIGGVWHVTGNLPLLTDGGVAEVYISKETGEILHLAHGR